MKKLYRVLVQTTNSYQPSSNWFNKEVLYCGFDKDEALIKYHSSSPADYFCGHGNRYRETKIQYKEIN